jgi:phage-related protein
MSLNNDYQKLEPGNTVRLFEVDGTAFGVGEVLRFHNHNIPHTEAEISAAGGDESKLPAKSIWWQGVEYSAWPCQIDGLEKSTTGSGATPKLTVANLDGSITALCLAYDDLLKATVTIHDTWRSIWMRAISLRQRCRSHSGNIAGLVYRREKYRNIRGYRVSVNQPDGPAGGNDPDPQLHSLCSWCIRGKYRSGDGCDYAGTNYFDKNNNPVADPSLDQCNGTLTACKLRFGENNELSFGGFPGTSLIRS